MTFPDPKITPELVQEHNLTTEEYERITAMLGRIATSEPDTSQVPAVSFSRRIRIRIVSEGSSVTP